MVTLTTPVCEFGLKAPEFNLLGVDNNFWSLKDCMGEKGLLVMFISNHCPYVKAVQNRLIRDTNELKALGINCVAIMPNDTIEYPEDAFENMQLVSENNNYSFPYLLDDTQDIARAFGAICTPDFFGYNNHYELQYRGRLDATGRNTEITDTHRELFEAMKLVAETGNGPTDQTPSIGCSIKWKKAAQPD